MDKQTALEILIANACCSSLALTCEECPLYDPKESDDLVSCRDFSDAEVAKAVKVMKGMNSDG